MTKAILEHEARFWRLAADSWQSMAVTAAIAEKSGIEPEWWQRAERICLKKKQECITKAESYERVIIQG